MASESTRLFFAIWPDADARGRFAATARTLVGPGRARPVRADSVHVTLAFLGDVEAGRREAAVAAAGRVAFEPFQLEFDRVDCRARQRIAWAAATRAPAGLLALAADLREALLAGGFALESRPFLPHLTLVRDFACGSETRPMASIGFAVREFTLVRSALTPTGPVYTIERSFAARPAATGGAATRP